MRDGRYVRRARSRSAWARVLAFSPAPSGSLTDGREEVEEEEEAAEEQEQVPELDEPRSFANSLSPSLASAAAAHILCNYPRVPSLPPDGSY